MNKFIVLLAFAAFVGYVSAGGSTGTSSGKFALANRGSRSSVGSNIGNRIGLEEEVGGLNGFEGGHLHHTLGHGLEHINDIILIEELRRRGHARLIPGTFGGIHGEHVPPISPAIPLRARGGRRGGLGVGSAGGLGVGSAGGLGVGGASGLGVGSAGGLGAAGTAGAIGGSLGANQRADQHVGSLNARQHEGNHNSVEGNKGGSIGAAGRFDVDHHTSNHNTVEGGTKHSVIDKDQLVVRNKVNGFSDSKGFRTSTGNREDDHVGASAGILANGEESGRIESDQDADNSLNAFHAGNSEASSLGAAGGAIGAAGGLID